MKKPSDFGDHELHAYIDNALPPDLCAEFEQHLAGNPELAARVEAYRAQKQAIKALCAPLLAEPVPPHLQAAAQSPQTTPSGGGFLSRWSLQRIAASVLIAALSATGGWMAHEQFRPEPTLARLSPLPRQAAVAHVVYSPDVRRPVEINAEHEDQLVAWLSKRLGTPIRPPKLTPLGFELIGGRLLPGNSGPVAQFMYHDATGQRLTLYVSTENTERQDTAFRFAQEGPVNVFYWVDGSFGYALSAGIDKNALARVATAVYDQLERR